MNMKKRCLVLGANGFVGSHLVDTLASSGYRVRAFDRFSKGPKFNSSELVEVYKGDIYNQVQLKESLRNVDVVFHCFSATTPFTSDNDPFSDIDKNLIPSVEIFNSCVASGVSKIIFISSGGAIYGKLSEVKAPSEDDATTPVSPYGIVKLAIENYLAYFNRKSNIDYLIYRLTNPYGPRQSNSLQGVIPIFASRILNDEELVVYGDGESSRDYLYIRDATRMIVKSFDQQCKYNTYNIGSGRQTTLNEIIKALEKVTGKKALVTNLPSPSTFLRKSQVNVERFTKEFALTPETMLLDGIEQMLTEDRISLS